MENHINKGQDSKKASYGQFKYAFTSLNVSRKIEILSFQKDHVS